MQNIFDREFRREKQLELNKRLGEKKAPGEKDVKKGNKDKLAQ